MTTLFGEEIERSAAFSDDRVYRYTLERYWDTSIGHVLFILLNPSTADAQHDDPTNRRGMGYARDWGFGGVVFVNLFAYRTSNPSLMKEQKDPVGPDNNAHIIQQATVASRTVLAWGMHGTHLNRSQEVVDLLTMFTPWALPRYFGFTQNCQPKHPLYLRSDAPLHAFNGLLGQDRTAALKGKP